jgi:hypothetical protein
MKLKDKIHKLVLNNDFNELENLLENVDREELRSGILGFAFQSQSIVAYTIPCMLLIKKDTAELHYIVAEVLATALCHLEGAYSSALCHARRAVELDPTDVSLKEFLLLFHDIPEKLISTEEAKKIAAEVIKEKPDSSSARDILDE